ncbi:reticulocyte-binding protein 2-like [Onthophagus taurus]|uniref:reticulocyte-binding protein 2-like n=1 Tax=Onthophagus taurus TaxID=166361 RepID=UPI000C20AC26|nr:uncharacterized protein LOC111426214 [Onthophagus taurus]
MGDTRYLNSKRKRKKKTLKNKLSRLLNPKEMIKKTLIKRRCSKLHENCQKKSILNRFTSRDFFKPKPMSALMFPIKVYDEKTEENRDTKLLFSSNCRSSDSTDDVQAQSEFKRINARKENNLNQQCYISNSGTLCMAQEMYPIFVEWYKFLKQNQSSLKQNFQFFGKIKPIPDNETTPEISNTDFSTASTSENKSYSHSKETQRYPSFVSYDLKPYKKSSSSSSSSSKNLDKKKDKVKSGRRKIVSQKDAEVDTSEMNIKMVNKSTDMHQKADNKTKMKLKQRSKSSDYSKHDLSKNLSAISSCKSTTNNVESLKTDELPTPKENKTLLSSSKSLVEPKSCYKLKETPSKYLKRSQSYCEKFKQAEFIKLKEKRNENEKKMENIKKKSSQHSNYSSNLKSIEEIRKNPTSFLGKDQKEFIVERRQIKSQGCERKMKKVDLDFGSTKSQENVKNPKKDLTKNMKEDKLVLIRKRNKNKIDSSQNTDNSALISSLTPSSSTSSSSRNNGELTKLVSLLSKVSNVTNITSDFIFKQFERDWSYWERLILLDKLHERINGEEKNLQKQILKYTSNKSNETRRIIPIFFNSNIENNSTDSEQKDVSKTISTITNSSQTMEDREYKRHFDIMKKFRFHNDKDEDDETRPSTSVYSFIKKFLMCIKVSNAAVEVKTNDSTLESPIISDLSTLLSTEITIKTSKEKCRSKSKEKTKNKLKDKSKKQFKDKYKERFRDGDENDESDNKVKSTLAIITTIKNKLRVIPKFLKSKTKGIQNNSLKNQFWFKQKLETFHQQEPNSKLSLTELIELYSKKNENLFPDTHYTPFQTTLQVYNVNEELDNLKDRDGVTDPKQMYPNSHIYSDRLFLAYKRYMALRGGLRRAAPKEKITPLVPMLDWSRRLKPPGIPTLQTNVGIKVYRDSSALHMDIPDREVCMRELEYLNDDTLDEGHLDPQKFEKILQCWACDKYIIEISPREQQLMKNMTEEAYSVTPIEEEKLSEPDDLLKTTHSIQEEESDDEFGIKRRRRLLIEPSLSDISLPSDSLRSVDSDMDDRANKEWESLPDFQPFSALDPIFPVPIPLSEPLQHIIYLPRSKRNLLSAEDEFCDCIRFNSTLKSASNKEAVSQLKISYHKNRTEFTPPRAFKRALESIGSGRVKRRKPKKSNVTYPPCCDEFLSEYSSDDEKKGTKFNRKKLNKTFPGDERKRREKISILEDKKRRQEEKVVEKILKKSAKSCKAECQTKRVARLDRSLKRQDAQWRKRENKLKQEDIEWEKEELVRKRMKMLKKKMRKKKLPIDVSVLFNKFKKNEKRTRRIKEVSEAGVQGDFKKHDEIIKTSMIKSEESCCENVSTKQQKEKCCTFICDLDKKLNLNNTSPVQFVNVPLKYIEARNKNIYRKRRRKKNKRVLTLNKATSINSQSFTSEEEKECEKVSKIQFTPQLEVLFPLPGGKSIQFVSIPSHNRIFNQLKNKSSKDETFFGSSYTKETIITRSIFESSNNSSWSNIETESTSKMISSIISINDEKGCQIQYFHNNSNYFKKIKRSIPSLKRKRRIDASTEPTKPPKKSNLKSNVSLKNVYSIIRTPQSPEISSSIDSEDFIHPKHEFDVNMVKEILFSIMDKIPLTIEDINPVLKDVEVNTMELTQHKDAFIATSSVKFVDKSSSMREIKENKTNSVEFTVEELNYVKKLLESPLGSGHQDINDLNKEAGKSNIDSKIPILQKKSNLNKKPETGYYQMYRGFRGNQSPITQSQGKIQREETLQEVHRGKLQTKSNQNLRERFSNEKSIDKLQEISQLRLQVVAQGLPNEIKSKKSQERSLPHDDSDVESHDDSDNDEDNSQSESEDDQKGISQATVKKVIEPRSQCKIEGNSQDKSKSDSKNKSTQNDHELKSRKISKEKLPEKSEKTSQTKSHRSEDKSEQESLKISKEKLSQKISPQKRKDKCHGKEDSRSLSTEKLISKGKFEKTSFEEKSQCDTQDKLEDGSESKSRTQFDKVSQNCSEIKSQDGSKGECQDKRIDKSLEKSKDELQDEFEDESEEESQIKQKFEDKDPINCEYPKEFLEMMYKHNLLLKVLEDLQQNPPKEVKNVNDLSKVKKVEEKKINTISKSKSINNLKIIPDPKVTANLKKSGTTLINEKINQTDETNEKNESIYGKIERINVLTTSYMNYGEAHKTLTGNRKASLSAVASSMCSISNRDDVIELAGGLKYYYIDEQYYKDSMVQAKSDYTLPINLDIFDEDVFDNGVCIKGSEHTKFEQSRGVQVSFDRKKIEKVRNEDKVKKKELKSKDKIDVERIERKRRSLERKLLKNKPNLSPAQRERRRKKILELLDGLPNVEVDKDDKKYNKNKITKSSNQKTEELFRKIKKDEYVINYHNYSIPSTSAKVKTTTLDVKDDKEKIIRTDSTDIVKAFLKLLKLVSINKSK